MNSLVISPLFFSADVFEVYFMSHVRRVRYVMNINKCGILLDMASALGI